MIDKKYKKKIGPKINENIEILIEDTNNNQSENQKRPDKIEKKNLEEQKNS